MYIMSFIYVSILPQIWAFVSSKKAKSDYFVLIISKISFLFASTSIYWLNMI